MNRKIVVGILLAIVLLCGCETAPQQQPTKKPNKEEPDGSEIFNPNTGTFFPG